MYTLSMHEKSTLRKDVHSIEGKTLSEDEAKKNAPIMLEAQDMLRKWEAGDAETLDLWKKMNEWVYEGFNKTYKALGVAFDINYFESDTFVLSSSVGHLLSLIAPNDPVKGKWSFTHLPVIPPQFELNPSDKKSTERLKMLVRLIKRKDVSALINACDAGREGELIFRYIEQYAGQKKPVQRLWLQSMTQDAIRDAFENLRPDAQMKRLEAAARSRRVIPYLKLGAVAVAAAACFGGGYKVAVWRATAAELERVESEREAARLGNAKAAKAAGRTAPDDHSRLAALGFLTLGNQHDGRRNDIIDDRIDVISKAFLGLTVSCARCHDHKFDPIPTADYYSLYGVLANTVEPPSPLTAPALLARVPQTPELEDYLAQAKALAQQDADLRAEFASLRRRRQLDDRRASCALLVRVERQAGRECGSCGHHAARCMR
jgi:hypothetical protein